ncbi:hypothetical protein LIA77_07000 [Sarocladium implicatum]|nr:hypothetical protein LIA77_07000 [Sarocladium implicatum]
MRYLYVAALLGVSTNVVAYRVAKSDLEPISETLFLTLQLPVGEDGLDIVRLPLDFHPSDEACDPKVLTINGDHLPVMDGGVGSGLLRLEGGQTLSTAWAFSCDEEIGTETVDLVVEQYDGEDIPPVSITVTHVKSTDDELGSVVYSQQQIEDSSSSRGDLEATRAQRHKEIDDQLSQMNRLRAQAAKLATIASASEDDASGNLVDCVTDACMEEELQYDNLKDAKSMAERLISERLGTDGLKTTIQSGGDPQQQSLIITTISQPGSSSPDEVYVYEEVFPHALISALAFALFVFVLFSLFSVLYAHRERIRTALAERRARRHDRRRRWFRTWAERRAEKEARKQAIRDFFSHLIGRFLSHSAAEKKAAEEERTQVLLETQAEEGRLNQSEQFVNMSERISLEAQQTSMAQEIAGLRAAAAMVEDIVNATSMPRPQGQPQLQRKSTEAPLAPTRTSMSESITYDDVPPSYEEQSHDSAVVADGFRYEPGSRGRFSHTMADVSLSSDRLGYDK